MNAAGDSGSRGRPVAATCSAPSVTRELMVEESGMRPSGASPSRGRKVLAAVALLLAVLMLGGGAIAWKMRAERGSTGGGTTEGEGRREELARIRPPESAFVRPNGRYAASFSELGTPLTS